MKTFKITIKEPGKKPFVQYAEAANEEQAIKTIKACVLIRPGATFYVQPDLEPLWIQNN